MLPDPDRYSQQRERDDVRCVLDALGIERAHIVGLSMGAMATLHFGMVHSARAISLVTAGVGSGAHKSEYARFQADSRAHAKLMLEHGMARFAAGYGENPTRVTMKAKDPRGFAEFQRHLSEHSAEGSANTMLGYQARRPSLYDLTAEMAGITAPLLVIAGDEDPSTIEPSLLIKRTVPGARLAMLPRTGHMLNLEEPALFNRLVEDFFHQVEAGRGRD